MLFEKFTKKIATNTKEKVVKEVKKEINKEITKTIDKKGPAVVGLISMGVTLYFLLDKPVKSAPAPVTNVINNVNININIFNGGVK